jgi:hypothetical protein
LLLREVGAAGPEEDEKRDPQQAGRSESSGLHGGPPGREIISLYWI